MEIFYLELFIANSLVIVYLIAFLLPPIQYNYSYKIFILKTNVFETFFLSQLNSL
ncbi:hypothetical protein MACH08_42500 [Oceanobacillus kimchii]|uniref:Uncharacterized protein n=1 Tax=Oceanobacillus kimchii TaxID=746691 RepID=A0ABQ5TNS3_9BACI|nr:hypothetical protein MACH08_42500 [Oceanobacillus kimchii]